MDVHFGVGALLPFWLRRLGPVLYCSRSSQLVGDARVVAREDDLRVILAM
jgi:hypothetical protein